MRAYSPFLYGIKTEKISAKYHLAGSTPPPPPTRLLKAQFKTRYDEKFRVQLMQQTALRIAGHAKINANQVALIPGGASQAYFQALAALTESGDEILVESPRYDPFQFTAQFLNLKVRRFERTASFAQDVKHLKKTLAQSPLKTQSKNKVLVLSNPHCPTGWMLNTANIEALLDLGLKLIIDEAFLPLFQGQMSLCQNYLATDQVVSLGTLSKSVGMFSTRTGWCLSSAQIRDRVFKVGLQLHGDPQTLPLQAACEALKNWRPLLQNLKQMADQNRPLLRAFYEQHPQLCSQNMQNGYFASLHIPKKFKSAEQFSQHLLKDSVFVRSLETFAMPQHIRLHWLLPKSAFTKAFACVRSYYR